MKPYKGDRSLPKRPRRDPDTQVHAFSTFLGLPPDTDTPPACGAAITTAYGNVRPTARCPECDRLVAEHDARKAALSAKQETR